MNNKKYTFIDFFCGAGGFSEGFRQQGFYPIRGIEMWDQALNTHNLNFGLNDKTKNVLDFEDDEEIEKLEDSHILLGSPPCVSFSMANKSGKADKSLGIRLIEAYLRVVAVKKHQKNSKLIGWFMENVPNSKNYVKEEYSFEELNLTNWANKNKINPKKMALKVKNNGEVFNSNNYGSPQKRERFICGEFIKTGEFPSPEKDSGSPIVLGDILKEIPSPKLKDNSKTEIVDPNYESLKMPIENLSDHFYDTGVYSLEWEKAKRAKVNHPFGGKMSFPENLEKPSRTIMATRSAGTRESLIYKSEYTNRIGDGEYRLPTIREVATLMGYPYIFHFTGTETTKWKQIGNAVSPHMSFALAKALKKLINPKEVIEHRNISFNSIEESNSLDRLEEFKYKNLNSSKEKVFNKPPKRKKGGKVRRHFYKTGNMTIALLNYDHFDKNIEVGSEFNITAFLGSGKAFKVEKIKKDLTKDLEKIIKDNLGSSFKEFIKEAKGILKNIPSKEEVQKLYEEDKRDTKYLTIDNFFNLGENLIEKHYCENLIEVSFLKGKNKIPLNQVLSLYLIQQYINNF